tara:strand:+ start:285 stop:458 length:174 start_codon:yes stop_codon:yes gene_type:complete
MMAQITLDITQFTDKQLEMGGFAQEKYLVHGHDDVYWTSDLDEALTILKQSLITVDK